MAYEVAAGVIGVGILFFIGMIASFIDQDDHSLLKMFLLLFGLWYAVGLLNLSMQIITDNSGATAVFNTVRTLYWSMVVVSFFTTMYFVLYYIKIFIETIQQKKEDKRFKLG